MTPRLPVVTGKELARVAERVGFVRDRQTGSHAVFVREADHSRVVIPMHAGKAIKPKTLAAILDDMGVSPDELPNLL